jgi:suppressor for copper-sensitivity B
MLATLLATPCSAPFVGTAVGFALSRGPVEILAIFTALGIGLAAPYLLVAAAPRLATRLPRPGRWMVWLRRGLGLALAGTALWLLAILAAQTGLIAALSVGALGAGIAVLLGLGGRIPAAYRAGGVAVLVALALAVPMAVRTSGPAAAAADARWIAFDREAIPGLVGEGRTVFVDVTADWCITCQVNKAMVLTRDPVARRLAGDESVVTMRADWTRPSDAIASYLAAFGRYGIPFNAVYGPGAPTGIPLPELLTTQAVLDALDRAAAPASGAPQS